MQTARTLGISLRRLDGWTPKRETRHEYERGHLVRSVEWVEPEWDATAAGWMLALTTWEATRCPACGGDRDECWPEDNRGEFKVPAPMRCHRETALAKARKTYAETEEPSALMYRAELRR